MGYVFAVCTTHEGIHCQAQHHLFLQLKLSMYPTATSSLKPNVFWNGLKTGVYLTVWPHEQPTILLVLTPSHAIDIEWRVKNVTWPLTIVQNPWTLIGEQYGTIVVDLSGVPLKSNGLSSSSLQKWQFW